jgi:adenylylsulfate kinase-like enzyme
MAERRATIPGLLITGTIGSGKTSLATEIGDVLEEMGRVTAIVDLDWLGWISGPESDQRDHEAIILKNLQAIWPNLVDAGAERLVLARVIQTPAHLHAIRETLPDVEFTVVLVTASAETIAHRLKGRDTAGILEEHLVESVRFEEIVRRAGVEDFSVSNEDRPLRDVVSEVLQRAGWA